MDEVTNPLRLLQGSLPRPLHFQTALPWFCVAANRIEMPYRLESTLFRWCFKDSPPIA